MNESPAPAPHSDRFDPDFTAILHCLPDAQSLAQLSSLHRAMVTHGHRRDDPVRRLMSYLGDRWSVLILLVLGVDTLRYRQLHRVINLLIPHGEKQLSQRMLTLRLGDLEAEGLILREATDDNPPQVHYQISPFGSDYIARIRDIIDWIVNQTGQGTALSGEAFHLRRDRPRDA